MGPLDWLRRVRKPPPDPRTWQVAREGGDVVVTDGRRESRFTSGAARSIRLVPLGVGPGHGTPQGGRGWQIAVRRDDGDIPIGPAVEDWRAALEFARRLSETSGVPIDEVSERLFSGLGQPDVRA